MRITATDTYLDHACDLDDCARNYCRPHRMLWRDCETVKEGMEGDRDVVGGTRTVFELGDCPKCEREYEIRRYQRWVAQKNAA